MKKNLLILMTLFISLVGYSQTFTALDNNNNTLEYNITSANTVEVKNYISGGSDIDIPTTVDNTVSSVTTTYTVTSIGITAFISDGLTSVIIPNSVLTIGIAAFASNNNLDSVVIGNSVTSIGDAAFRYAILTSVTIPYSVTDIGKFAFYDTTLTSVILEGTTPPTIITGVEDSFGNRSVIDLTIPSGTSAAYSTGGWTGFNSVTEASALALGDTFVVDYITYEVTSVASDTVAAIDYDMAGGTVVNIPASVPFNASTFTVTSIGNLAFSQNQLVSVTIPDSVTYIGYIAFGNNSATLTDVISLSTTPPTIQTGTNNSFGDRSNVHLHIPAGTMGAYVTDAGALWTGFNPVSEDALSVSDFELDNSIKVITTADEIKVISPDSIRLENYTIYSISGAKVSSGKESVITTSSFAKGIYVLKLELDRGTITKKVLVN